MDMMAVKVIEDILDIKVWMEKMVSMVWTEKWDPPDLRVNLVQKVYPDQKDQSGKKEKKVPKVTLDHKDRWVFMGLLVLKVHLALPELMGLLVHLVFQDQEDVKDIREHLELKDSAE